MIANDGKQVNHHGRQKLFAKVSALAAEELAGLASAERIEEFLAHYFLHVGSSPLLARPASQLTKGLLAQAKLAMTRQPGQNSLQIIIPDLASDGWDAGGHTVVMLITDDKEWLVDTLRLAISQQGWSVRDIVHPQYLAIRASDGKLLDMVRRDRASEAIAESWVWLELSAPLGKSASDMQPALQQAIEESLADLDAATQDAKAMRDMMLAAGELVAKASGSEAGPASEMMHWLADDRFLLLGARDFYLPADQDTYHFEPAGPGLGILRDDQRARMSFGAPAGADELLVITKDSQRSRVGRPSYCDYIAIHYTNAEGKVLERRFLGLFTAAATEEQVADIPILRHKAAQIAARIGYKPDSYGGRLVAWAIETHPRDELFQSDVESLTNIINQVVRIEDSHQVTVFLRRSRWQRFLTALIYFPRERYSTAVRQRIVNLMTKLTDAESSQWRVNVADSPLARLYFTIKVPEGKPLPQLDLEKLGQAIEQVSRTWDDRFLEIADRLDSAQRGVEFSEAYKEAYSPVDGINDLVALNQLSGPDDLAQTMYVPSPPENGVDFRIKLARVGAEMVLSKVLPHLSSMGVDVIDERPYELELRGEAAHVYDFGIRLPGGPERLNGWSHDGRSRFTQTVAASYFGLTEADALHRLVTNSDLNWRQVSVLRAISRYLRQLGTTYSQPYIAETLHRHTAISRQLVQLFEAKFDPYATAEERATRADEALAEINAGLAKVKTLDEDRIIRQFLAVLQAMVRTNYFALPDEPRPSGTPKLDWSALAFKVIPGQLNFVAQPQPKFEIFVYSPQVEGVHLRFGKIARGGIRWSDRAEDYRTEVLGLVRAQMVKNSIIVPVGAKGGFHPLRLAGLTGKERLTEAKASYCNFIRALLSVTDNIVDGKVVHPENVVPTDGDDTYLVVAADKGTASFSDMANSIAIEKGYWLSDAFASGGSAGYDHKAMGITARGAWISVARHLHELGIDDQADPFTCVGIGDMSGDVFGNGMLLSKQIRLVAAFNHKHIFLDPNPDPAVSYAERERLFKMPGSNWSDYNPELISQGGGVYDRKVKSVPIGAQVREALGLCAEITELTPNALISAILRAPVDLLWNGGIGTWVKASTESHAQVGDRANDPVRVNANQVRAKCVGEGGNLGWTHAARIEYAQAGGKINTDFIDNSAGVDTSDHEVNIKILLQPEVAKGVLTMAERNELLAQMSDEVAQLVLAHNQAQNRALANSLNDAVAHAGLHEELMNVLEARAALHRGLDGLPSEEEMRQRIANGQGLTDPELCTLLASVKIDLAEQILESDLPEDPYLADRLIKYFPVPLRERYAADMPKHPLAREIITTVAVNRFVDSQGISAANRLCEETGAGAADVIRAQLAARNLVDAGLLEVQANRSKLPAATKRKLLLDIRSLVERATRWLLHEYREQLDIDAIVAELKPGVREVMAQLPQLLTTAGWQRRAKLATQLVEAGIPTENADLMASWRIGHLALPIVRVALKHGRDLATTAKVYFALSERIGVDKALLFSEQLPRAGRWEIMARAGVREEMTSVQAAITSEALAMSPASDSVDQIVDAWWQEHPQAGDIRDLLAEVSAAEVDLAPIAVAVTKLRNLINLT